MTLPLGVHDPSAFIDSLWESVEVEGVRVSARVHLSEVTQSVESGWEAAVLRNTLLVACADVSRFPMDALVTVRGRFFVVRETSPRAGSGMFWEVVLAEETPPRVRAALAARLPAPRAAISAALRYDAALSARAPSPRVAVRAEYLAPVVRDAFTRANSTTSLGNAETGHAWVALAGTWGISGNQAYNPSATANGLAVVNAGVADCMVRATISTFSNQSGIVARVQDASNLLRLAYNGAASLRLQRVAAGVGTTIFTATVSYVVGDVIALRLAGPQITVFVNGVALGTVTEATYATLTRHGIGLGSAGSSTARWGNFAAHALGVP